MISFKKAGKFIIGTAACIAFALGGVYYVGYRLSSSFSLNQAHDFERVGDLEQAEKKYTEAINRSPENPDAHIGRGDVRRRTGDNEGSREDYENAADEIRRRYDLPEIEEWQALSDDVGIDGVSLNPFASSTLEERLFDGRRYNEANEEDELEDGGEENLKEKIEELLKRGVERFKSGYECNDITYLVLASDDFKEVISLDDINEYGYLDEAKHNLGVSDYFISQLEGGDFHISNARIISIDYVSEAIELDPNTFGYRITRGNLWQDEALFYDELADVDSTSAWQSAYEDFKFASDYCGMGRALYHLNENNRSNDTLTECNINRNLCIDAFRKGEVESFPGDYYCPVLIQNSSGNYIRYEYDVDSGDFVAQ